jgi:Peptidase family M28
VRPRQALPLLFVVLVAVTGVLTLQPPGPPAHPALDQFNVHLAFQDDLAISQQVHPTGSAAADAVRDYIVQTLRQDGLQPQVQDTTGVNAGKFGAGNMAHVRDVVATIPGGASTGRVILMAHDDSVQVSYGANDDGAGVSTLLETARALTSSSTRLRNDVTFVFTDAEEACLCGAEAFVTQNPIAQQPAVVLNMESRGSNGPTIMFQTSPHNSGVVSVYARSAPYPVATSVAAEIYRRLPNDTDFTPVLDAGRFTGLNAAYIDGQSAYHSPLDRHTNLDLRSLQGMGDNALALARGFGQADLVPLVKPSSGDDTYFPILGWFLVRYPGWLVLPIAIVALLAVAALGGLFRRRSLS